MCLCIHLFIDLGGLQVTNELKEEQFHFLVFTDVFGNRTHGVVMQYYRLIMVCKNTPFPTKPWPEL